MSPRKILLFFIAVGLILAIPMFLLPPEGVKFLSFTIQMPDYQELFGNKQVKYADISKIVKDTKNIDSLPDILSGTKHNGKIDVSNINIGAIELADNIHRIEFLGEDKSDLHNFFNSLLSCAKEGKTVRVLHYGDSQIEGDRITSFVRNRLQKIFGGGGPGLIPALQPYDSYITMRQKNKGDWTRYAVFGADTRRIKGKKYGALAAFSRFSPRTNDSIFHLTHIYEGDIILQESNLAYASAKKYRKFKLYYGNNKTKVQIQLFDGESLIAKDSLHDNTDLSIYSFEFDHQIKNLRIHFSGNDSPDIYGITLDDFSGVAVDNIGMRGNSGTIFGTINNNHLQRMYSDLNVKLFILQFGGNVMPYTKSEKSATDYGNWFYAQIQYIKKMSPGSAILVIGPSDMSYKDKDKYVTYPYLESVRDALKQAAFKSGVGYWDLYSAMGGKNSMPSWVDANPPLAGTDYTHFTPKGASVVANMFYNALMLEFVEFKK